MWVNIEHGQFSHSPLYGDGWQETTVEEFNTLRSNGFNPVEAPPWAISNADLRRGLIERGINPELITAYLKSLDDGPAKWAAIADWEFANYFERAHPLLDQLAPSFGLSSTDVDDLFRSKPAYPIR